jgi:hypothetical protein
MMMMISLFLSQTHQVAENTKPVDYILCIPSHNGPKFAIFFPFSPVPVGLRPSPLPIALWVPSQGGVGDLTVAFHQGMAKPFKCSYHDF